jgi:hypothetical protein
MLRQPSSRWVRIPAGILLIAGGVLSFLPVPGLWMIPLGLLLLTQGMAILQRQGVRWSVDPALGFLEETPSARSLPPL